MENNTASTPQGVNINQFIASAYHAYAGSVISYSPLTKEKSISITSYALSLDGISFSYHTDKSRGSVRGSGFEGCKLQLHHLSTIILEHIEQVAVMALQSRTLSEDIEADEVQVGTVSKDNEKTCIQVFCRCAEYDLYIFNDFRLVIIPEGTTDTYSVENQVDIIDFLREQSYALPFRGLDLVAAGIAEYVQDPKKEEVLLDAPKPKNLKVFTTPTRIVTEEGCITTSRINVCDIDAKVNGVDPVYNGLDGRLYKVVASRPQMHNTLPLSLEFLQDYINCEGNCDIEYSVDGNDVPVFKVIPRKVEDKAQATANLNPADVPDIEFGEVMEKAPFILPPGLKEDNGRG